MEDRNLKPEKKPRRRQLSKYDRQQIAHKAYRMRYVRHWDIGRIAEALNTSPATIRKYLRDVMDERTRELDQQKVIEFAAECDATYEELTRNLWAEYQMAMDPPPPEFNENTPVVERIRLMAAHEAQKERNRAFRLSVASELRRMGESKRMARTELGFGMKPRGEEGHGEEGATKGAEMQGLPAAVTKELAKMIMARALQRRLPEPVPDDVVDVELLPSRSED